MEKVQLEISDVEVSWHETSPAHAYCIQMCHRREWGYPKAHLHPQYSSWALTCISQHAHTQVL